MPSGIATDSTTSLFFNALVSSNTLESFFDFENAAPLFDNVHRSYKFALITLAGTDVGVKETTFAFFAFISENPPIETRLPILGFPFIQTKG